jgi:outer membrane protein
MTEAATVTEAINGERSKKFTQDNTKKNCWLQRQCSKELKKNQISWNHLWKSKSFNPKIGKAKGFQYIVDGSSFIADGPNLTVMLKDLGF